jgi:hypothetical protein
MKIFVSLSKKGGKNKSPRSQFMSVLMKTLGGDTGDEVSNAFIGNDPETFVDKMTDVIKRVASKMPNAE